MTKEEARFSVMGAISMALKDPTLQQGFEIICKNLSELEKENEELKDKLNNLSKVAEVRLANWQKYEEENKELKMENNLAKSLLYCTKRTCDNCGFVNCENFQRQRKSEPCALYISYQDRIKNLTNESDVLRESFNNSEMNLSFVSEQLTKAKDLIRILLRETYGEGWNYSLGVKVKAEQFLKECENGKRRTERPIKKP